MDAFKHFLHFILHSLNDEKHGIEPDIILTHSKFKAMFKKRLTVAHPLIVVPGNSIPVAKRDADGIVRSRQIHIVQPPCSIRRIYNRFSPGTVVYRNASLNGCLVGSVQ